MKKMVPTDKYLAIIVSLPTFSLAHYCSVCSIIIMINNCSIQPPLGYDFQLYILLSRNLQVGDKQHIYTIMNIKSFEVLVIWPNRGVSNH